MKLITSLSTIALCVEVQSASAEEVRIYNWSDYIDEELLEKFEAETGINLVYDVFDSNEVLEAKLLAGSSGYDIVVPSSNWAKLQIEGGLYRKLDQAKLTNWKNVHRPHSQNPHYRKSFQNPFL